MAQSSNNFYEVSDKNIKKKLYFNHLTDFPQDFELRKPVVPNTSMQCLVSKATCLGAGNRIVFNKYNRNMSYEWNDLRQK